MNDELFDPQKMQEIVNRLRAEGRLPSAEEFLRVAEELREEVRPKLLDIINAERKKKIRRAHEE